MLPEVKTQTQKIDKYKGIISGGLYREIKKLSPQFKGLRVNMVNSTPRGGGVAEILKSLVPLMKGAGICAKWYTIPPRDDFFKITKEIHNALQGKRCDFSFWERVRYLQHIERSAFLMKDMEADIWVIHDPQPAGVILYLPKLHHSICHLHIDLTLPNKEAWNFIAGFARKYDKVIVSSKDFIQKEIKGKTVVCQPAIDPLSPKNISLGLEEAKGILKNYGINTLNPLIAQVSRFDPWKGFLELIEAYKIARKKISGLQLALVGFFLANDDPEAEDIYRIVKERTKDDPNVFLFSDPEMLGSLDVNDFVNAVQTASNVVLQNSIREGFGLSVTEAMWKQKAVIGGNAGGIRLQIQNGKNGFLVSNPKECAKRIIQLIKNSELAEELGVAAKESVRKNFLMPRLLRDYLIIFKQLAGND